MKHLYSSSIAVFYSFEFQIFISCLVHSSVTSLNSVGTGSLKSNRLLCSDLSTPLQLDLLPAKLDWPSPPNLSWLSLSALCFFNNSLGPSALPSTITFSFHSPHTLLGFGFLQYILYNNRTNKGFLTLIKVKTVALAGRRPAGSVRHWLELLVRLLVPWELSQFSPFFPHHN